MSYLCNDYLSICIYTRHPYLTITQFMHLINLIAREERKAAKQGTNWMKDRFTSVTGNVWLVYYCFFSFALHSNPRFDFFMFLIFHQFFAAGTQIRFKENKLVLEIMLFKFQRMKIRILEILSLFFLKILCTDASLCV